MIPKELECEIESALATADDIAFIPECAEGTHIYNMASIIRKLRDALVVHQEDLKWIAKPALGGKLQQLRAKQSLQQGREILSKDA